MKWTFFAKNRENFFQKLKVGSCALFFAGHAPLKRGDEYYPFSPDRNFYYLTGLDRENEILFFVKTETENQVILFIDRDNGEMAKWVGANITPQQAKEQSGIQEIHFLDEFAEEFPRVLFQKNISALYLDLERRSLTDSFSPALKFAETARNNYPSLSILNSYPIMAELRLIKREEEILLMWKAIMITCDGIRAMMSHAKPGMYEYELEAWFDFTLRKNGVRQTAFSSIIAAGKNSTVLHYTKNCEQTKSGDLVLADVGAQVDWYNGDITRTFPISGKFSERQKQIYNIVLEGQKRVIEAIQPGVPFSRLNEILKEFYYEELKNIGLIHFKEEVAKYYFHGVSHYLGAETHDIGRYDERILEPGMILTVEPGLYIQEWGFGIRIEDDALVIEDGCEILSEGMLKTAEEIEEFMANNAK